MATVHRLAEDLHLIDTHYSGTPEAIGVYLLTGDRPALIETGPASTVEAVLAGIRHAGLDPADLRALAVTHIHLDHAGAAGALVERLPHLDVYVHPLGAPHLIDPSRLLASAARLYGDALRPLFGEIRPVPGDRVRTLADGDVVALGDRHLVALHTPGHARHHLVYHDAAGGEVFTGDAAGVALPGLRYVRPPTPPPELDVPAWEATLDRLLGLGARRLLLTHFGPHAWVADLLEQLRARLRASVQLVRAAVEAGLPEDAVTARLREAWLADLRRADGDIRADRLETIMATQQSALGMLRYVRRAGG